MAAREYELKFDVAQDEIERLIAHPLLKPAMSGRHVSRLVSTYFDTPDARLRAAGISLRTRCSEAGTVQTLKRTAGSLVDRDEWERRDAGERPDPAWLRQTPLADVFEAPVVDALEPRFTADVMRTTLILHASDATIEGAIDQGALRADGVALPVNEFELELKDGSSGALVAFARELASDLPLVLSLASKAQRGHALADGSGTRAIKTITLHLDEGMTIAQAFTAIVQACLHTFLVDAALIGAGNDDVEPVHATRIALRRLRAALDLFKPVLRRRRAAAMMQDVKWMSDRLGDARDADVFRAEFAARERSTEAGSDEAAEAILERSHVEAHGALREALASSRFRVMLLDLLAFSEGGVRRHKGAKALMPFVRRRLDGRQKALVDAGRKPSHLSATAMHDVRKAAKMLRYNLEAFDDIAIADRPKRVTVLRDALQSLQQSLGDIHDADAMQAHLSNGSSLQSASGAGSARSGEDAGPGAAQSADLSFDRRKSLRKADKAARVVARHRPFHRRAA